VDTIFREAERMKEIVKKIGKITRFELKSYVGESQILDLERTSDEAEERAEEAEQPELVETKDEKGQEGAAEDGKGGQEGAPEDEKGPKKAS
jgi:hypothetical protein